MPNNADRKPRNAVYLLPNAFTTAALFAGFYAIFKAMEGNWLFAAWGILIAGVLDAADGRVARWTNTTSAFGREYDSLSDMVAFGTAPAIILYLWSLSELGEIGFGIAFCYCAATAFRLARFNCQTGTVDRRHFIGLPCPIAAATAVSYNVTIDRYDFAFLPHLTFVVTLILTLSMMSGMRYHSFKNLNLKSRQPFRAGLGIAAILALLYLVRDHVISILFFILIIYCLSGYIGYIYSAYTGLRSRADAVKKDD